MKTKIHTYLFECLGRIVSSRRKGLDLSQRELAAVAQVDRAFISEIEQGKRNPSLGVIARLAQALHMRLRSLVGRAEDCSRHKEVCADVDPPLVQN